VNLGAPFGKSCGCKSTGLKMFGVLIQ
jgi:hypothetical protein